jgi:hypothetical protein
VDPSKDTRAGAFKADEYFKDLKVRAVRKSAGEIYE